MQKMQVNLQETIINENLQALLFGNYLSKKKSATFSLKRYLLQNYKIRHFNHFEHYVVTNYNFATSPIKLCKIWINFRMHQFSRVLIFAGTNFRK